MLSQVGSCGLERLSYSPNGVIGQMFFQESMPTYTEADQNTMYKVQEWNKLLSQFLGYHIQLGAQKCVQYACAPCFCLCRVFCHVPLELVCNNLCGFSLFLQCLHASSPKVALTHCRPYTLP